MGFTIVLTFILFLYAGLSHAEALLAIDQPFWNNKTGIYVANCKEPPKHLANIHYLKSPTKDTTFIFLDMVIVREQDKQYIYAVSSEQEHALSKLYRFEIGKEFQEASQAKDIYRLPMGCTTAKLTLEPLENPLKTEQRAHQDNNLNSSPRRLLLTANASELSDNLPITEAGAKTTITKNRDKLSSFVAVFDVSDNESELKPTLHYDGIEGNLKDLIRPLILKLANGEEVIVLAGMERKENKESTACLQIQFLNRLKPAIKIATHAKQPLLHIMALDKTHQGFADTLYAWDKGGTLWKVELKDLSKATIQKISEGHYLLPGIESGHGIAAVKSLEQPGVTFYMLAQKEDKPSVLRFDEPHLGKPSLKTVCTSKATALFVRYGRLILVSGSQSKKEDIEVLELLPKGEQPLKVPRQNLIAEAEIFKTESTASSFLGQVHLLWDAKHQQEIIVSLNKNCNLNVTALEATKDKYGRLLWRKVNN